MHDRGDAGDAAAERLADEVRAFEAERAADAIDHRWVERVARIEVPRAAHRRALAEPREVERDRASPGCGDALDDLAPVLGPAADAVHEEHGLRTLSILDDADLRAGGLDPRTAHFPI